MPRRTAMYPEEQTLLGGKRPRSSMAPTFVMKDGEPFAAIGCPGGSTIIGAVTNALLGRIFHGLPLQTAVDLPRLISRNSGVSAMFDHNSGFPKGGFLETACVIAVCVDRNGDVLAVAWRVLGAR